MEDIFLIEVIKQLKYMYNCNNEEKVIKIFFIRSMIYNMSYKFDNNFIINFFLRELNLAHYKNIEFYNKIINKNYYGYDDCIESIIDNWKFQILEKSFININNNISTIRDELISEFKNYLKFAKKELKGLSKEKYYNCALKHIMFLQLYKKFNIDYIRECQNINGITSRSDTYNNYITIDLECHRYYEELFKNNIQYEKELEDYLYLQFNKTTNKLLFDEITILHRQYKIQNGIIDLLGKDKNNNIVVIELKTVKRPIDIFYQLKAYTSNIKEVFNTNNVRFVAITPKLSSDIFQELKKESISLYNYKKNIKDFSFSQVI